MDILIAIFVFLSYFLGAKSIIENRYKPSIYSRIIWLLLALNNYFSVLLLKASYSVLLLAGLGLLGNIVILLLSLRKSKKEFGKTELISTALLLTSLAIWVFTRLPILNLTIGLIAHFIGGAPTYKKAINNPKDEDMLFWLFFFLASALALVNIGQTEFSNYVYPLYFALFDGLMIIFCLRRYIKVK